MPIIDSSELGNKLVAKYANGEMSLNVRIEGKDVDMDLFLPIARTTLDQQFFQMQIAINDSSESDLKSALNQKAEYTGLHAGDRKRKEIDAYLLKVVEERQRWIRDCLLGAGLLDPSYTMLGRRGYAATAPETYAEHVAKRHELMVFDTNIFMRHLISNYLALRPSNLGILNTATAPAVIWELEDIANRDDREQSRLARSAFRDVARMQSSTKFQPIEARTVEPTSDRLIRQQVRDFKWVGTRWKGEDGKEYLNESKLFVTFDRVSSLAAQGEGMLCTSLDVPVEASNWSVKPVPSQTFSDMVGSFFVEIAICRGNVSIGDDSKTLRVSGDWAGKSNKEWIEGKVRID